MKAGRKRTQITAPDQDRRMPHESMGQWRARLAIDRQMARRAGEPLIPAEAEHHGDYTEDFITHVETNTKAWTKRNRMSSALAMMHERGAITPAQFFAAWQIAMTAELIQRAVSVKGASLEARVDQSGSARDHSIERLGHVRREQTYTRWRLTLPTPKRLVIDMVVSERPLVATARVYRVPWRKARDILIAALDRWIDIERRVADELDQEDLDRVNRRLEIAA
jgi:hypothetical protein